MPLSDSTDLKSVNLRRMNGDERRKASEHGFGPASGKARRFLIAGRVQGVGFRYFAQRAAREAGVTGWARNLDDGRVEVHADGSQKQLDHFEARLRLGPPSADIRGFEVTATSRLRLSNFDIR